MTTAIAEFHQIEPGELFVRNGAEFYQISPVKGARVAGTVSVGMTSHETSVPGSRSWDPKLTCPAMWIDYTPHFAAGNGSARTVITVNGRDYGLGFAASVSGRVEFMPADHYAHLSAYYPRATVDGRDYFLRASISQFDHVTDKAREALNSVAAAIAAQYVTDARWHAYRVDRAKYAVNRATDARDAAQAELDKAQAELDALL